MQIDNTTYSDLSVFQTTDEYSIFSKLDRTRTVGGRIQLLEFFSNPFSNLEKIRQTQEILRIIRENENEWGPSISNGTIMVMERFYETPLDKIPAYHDPVSAGMYQLLHAPDYSLTRYSIGHFADFIRGMLYITAILKNRDCPPLLKELIERVNKLLSPAILRQIAEKKSSDKLQASHVVEYGNFIRNHFKPSALTLIEIYGKLDAWYSMAISSREFNLVEPEFQDTEFPFIEIKGYIICCFRRLLPTMFKWIQKAISFFLPEPIWRGKVLS